MERTLYLSDWRIHLNKALFPLDAQDMAPHIISVSPSLFDIIVKDSKLEVSLKNKVLNFFDDCELKKNYTFLSPTIEVTSKRYFGKFWCTKILIKSDKECQYMIPPSAKFFTFNGVMYTNLWEL